VPIPWENRSPRDVATQVLNELFGTADTLAGRGRTPRRFPLAEFQEAGARRASRMLETWGGVLIADGVGLGKTYIALALIEEDLQRDGRVVVTVPAALRPVWRALLRDLSRMAEGRVHLLSHTQLSRGTYASGLAGNATLVVVDEAHQFRNPTTRRHAALMDVSRCARVVLITATPINNSTEDLHVLLRLFLPDDAFLDRGVPSLSELFGSSPPPAESIRRVLREVAIRRGRNMAGSSAGRVVSSVVVRFPRRAPPNIVRFTDPRIPELVAGIDALELRAYAVAGGSQGPGSVEALVRLGLLKRLESGPAALERSVTRLLGFLSAFCSALEAGRLLQPRWSAHRSGHEPDPLQLLLLDLVAGPCPPGLDRDELLASVRNDMARCAKMQGALQAADPKLDALLELLTAIQPEPCLVFTEFRDTAAALWRALSRAFPVARIDGGGAWLGERLASRGAVVRRFAPRSNGAAAPPARERVDVLIATDVLAEGMNLQDARHVVSYDLPWNPVRLMQRIGRVDRLCSPHDEVVPHLFLPEAGLEDILGLTRRLRVKLGSIASSLGDEESLQLLERMGRGRHEAAAALQELEHLQEDPLEELRRYWERLDIGAPPPEPARHAENRVAVGVVPASRPCHGPPQGSPHRLRAVVLVQTGGRPILMEVGSDGYVSHAGRRGTDLVAQALQHQPTNATDPTVSCTDVDAVTKDLHAHFRALRAERHAPSPLGSSDPAARLARVVWATLTEGHATPEPGVVARAERIIERLAVPLPQAAARPAARLLRELREGVAPSRETLDRIEAFLDHYGRLAPAPPRDGPDREGAEPVILAILLIGVRRPLPSG
jgi:hypothetical protein